MIPMLRCAWIVMRPELAAAQTGNVDARNGAQRIRPGEGFPRGLVAVDGQDRQVRSDPLYY